MWIHGGAFVTGSGPGSVKGDNTHCNDSLAKVSQDRLSLTVQINQTK